MSDSEPRTITKQEIIALAQASYGETGGVAIAKAAAELLYDPAIDESENILRIYEHLCLLPYEDPEAIAEKAYGFAKQKREADVLNQLRMGLGEDQHLDGSKAAREKAAAAKDRAQTAPPGAPRVPAPAGPQADEIKRPVRAARPQPAQPVEPAPTEPLQVLYRLKSGLTSLGTSAEATFKIYSEPGKALLIQKSGGLSPRLDAKKKEVRIVSGLGLLEGTIDNGSFVRNGYATLTSRNGREVYAIDLPEKLAILLPSHKKTQLKSSLAKKLAAYIQGVKDPTPWNLIAAVRRCNQDLSVGREVDLSVELKLLLFPVATKNKLA